MFLAFLLRGFSLPSHEFLRRLLFVYGVQLHQLTPNSLLHIACFITLCEAFLGIDPHWVLWKYLFRLHPSGSKGEILELGSAIIFVRSESQYLDFKMASQFKVGDRSGSTSRTKNPLNPINMGLPHDVYPRFYPCRQCWASKCRGL
jgi:hypothetical protein